MSARHPFEVSLPVNGALDLASTLAPLRLGHADPCCHSPTTGTVSIGLTERLSLTCEYQPPRIVVRLFGADREVAAARVPELLGLGFQAPSLDGPRRLRQLAHQFRGFRLPRTIALFPSVVRVVLQQLVSHHDACYAWRTLVTRYGTPAEGQGEILLPPSPTTIGRLSIDDFASCGILPEQGRRLRRLSQAAARLEEVWQGDSAIASREAACQMLSQLPGIGPWTIGYLRGAVMQDADATVPGDYSFPHQIVHFFEGRRRGSDDEMLQLLDAYRPYRFYVLMLILKSGHRPPRRGPRRPALRDHLRRVRQEP